MFALEAGQVFDDDVASIDIKLALGLEPSQIARNQFADGAEFGGEVLPTLRSPTIQTDAPYASSTADSPSQQSFHC